MLKYFLSIFVPALMAYLVFPLSENIVDENISHEESCIANTGEIKNQVESGQFDISGAEKGPGSACQLSAPPRFTKQAIVTSEKEKMSEKEIEASSVRNQKMLLKRAEHRVLSYTPLKEDEILDLLPRFPTDTTAPKDWRFYGLHLKNYKDVKTFLGTRECSHTVLSRLDNELRDDVLFLNININRAFQGRTRIINDSIRTPIEGALYFERFPPEYLIRNYYYEHLNFWIRSATGENYFNYGGVSINETNRSAWYFNSCSKGMSVAINECWLDQSYDMGLIDFFYLTKFDLLIGNFYCKKSHKSEWDRIATLEYLRVR